MKHLRIPVMFVLFCFSFLVNAENFWKGLAKDIVNPDPSVENVKLATDVQNGEALNEGTEFPADTDRLYVWFNHLGIKVDASIDTIWFFTQNKIAKEVGRTSYKVKAFENWGEVHMIKPDNDWLPGEYFVELRYNKALLKRVPFSITGGKRKAANQIDYGNDDGQVVEEYQDNPQQPAAKKSATSAKKPVAGQTKGTAADAEIIKQQVGASIHNEQTALAQFSYKLNKDILTKVGVKACPKCGFDNIVRKVDLNAFTITCPSCGKYSLSVAKLKDDTGATYQQLYQQKVQDTNANIAKFKEWGNAELQKKGLAPAYEVAGEAPQADDGVVVEELKDDSQQPVHTAPSKKTSQPAPKTKASEDFSF